MNRNGIRHGMVRWYNPVSWPLLRTKSLADFVRDGGSSLFLGAILAVALAGALVMPAILGLYLFSALNLFGFHANEAFSALRIQSHKNFLRFRIGPVGSPTIYALGLARPGGEPRIVDELVLNGTEL